MRVCRYWKEVAIQCSILWAAIPLRLNSSTSEVVKFWKRSVKRVKQTPASICFTISGLKIGSLRAPGYQSEIRAQLVEYRRLIKQALKACDLREIPVISLLRIEAGNLNLAQLLTWILHFPTGTLERLDLNGARDSDVYLPSWSWNAFLNKFPPFGELIVRSVSDFALDGNTPLLEIKRLILEDHKACTFPDLLLAVSNLEYMHIGPMFDQFFHQVAPGVEYSLPRLQTLSMDQMFSFPWGIQFTTPNITSYRLTTDEDVLEDERYAFLAACKSLRLVELGMITQDSITPLSRATDTIQHLTIVLEESYLPPIHWDDPDAEPFPHLKTLTLIYRLRVACTYPIDSDGDEDDDKSGESLDTAPIVTVEVHPNQFFDNLVVTRCLPRSNDASRLPEVLSPLAALKVTVSNRDVPSNWTDYTTHVENATAKVIEKTPFDTSITLSWVLGHDEVLGLIPESPFHGPL